MDQVGIGRRGRRRRAQGPTLKAVIPSATLSLPIPTNPSIAFAGLFQLEWGFRSFNNILFAFICVLLSSPLALFVSCTGKYPMGKWLPVRIRNVPLSGFITAGTY